MGAARQPREHATRIRGVRRLAQRAAIDHHLGVGPEDRAALRHAGPGRNLMGLAPRVDHDPLTRRERRVAPLILLRGDDPEGHAERCQQPPPLGRAGGQDDQSMISESAKWMPSSRAADSVPSDPWITFWPRSSA